MNARKITFRGNVELLTELAIIQHGCDTLPVTTIADPAHGLVQTAFAPGTNFRGALRRAATRALRRDLIAAGKPVEFDMKTYYMLAIGGTRDRGDALLVDATTEGEVRTRNPLISVFGAADTGDETFLAGKLATEHMFPESPIGLDACPKFPIVRVDDMRRQAPETLELLAAGESDVWLAQHAQTRTTSVLKKDHKAKVAALMKAKRAGESELVQQLDAEARALEGAIKTGAQSVQNIVPGYQALPRGARLVHKMLLMNPSDVEFGLLLAALEEFAWMPYLGGHRAHGCGEVAMTWDVVDHVQGQAAAPIGKIAVGVGGLELPEHPSITRAQSAYRNALAAIDPSYHVPAAADEAADA